MTVVRDDLDDALDAFKAKMQWSDDSTDMEKTLVLGNLNGFVGHLRRLRSAEQSKDSPSESTACGHRVVASRSGLYDRSCPYYKGHAVHTDPNCSAYHQWAPRETKQAFRDSSWSDAASDLLTLAGTGFGYDLQDADRENLVNAAKLLDPKSVEAVKCDHGDHTVFRGHKAAHDRIVHGIHK